jgi:hypothetical protein
MAHYIKLICHICGRISLTIHHVIQTGGHVTFKKHFLAMTNKGLDTQIIQLKIQKNTV